MPWLIQPTTLELKREFSPKNLDFGQNRRLQQESYPQMLFVYGLRPDMKMFLRKV